MSQMQHPGTKSARNHSHEEVFRSSGSVSDPNKQGNSNNIRTEQYQMLMEGQLAISSSKSAKMSAIWQAVY